MCKARLMVTADKKHTPERGCSTQKGKRQSGAQIPSIPSSSGLKKQTRESIPLCPNHDLLTARECFLLRRFPPSTGLPWGFTCMDRWQVRKDGKQQRQPSFSAHVHMLSVCSMSAGVSLGQPGSKPLEDSYKGVEIQVSPWELGLGCHL